MKTYGNLSFVGGGWEITELEPHAAIKLKNLFPKIPKWQAGAYRFANTTEVCTDLEWFTQRYPLRMTDADLAELRRQKSLFHQTQADMEAILSPDYTPRDYDLKPGQTLRTWIYALVQIFRLHLGFFTALIFTVAWFWLGEWYKKTQTECADDLTPEEKCMFLECERDLLQVQNDILAGTVEKLSSRPHHRLLLTEHLLREIHARAAVECTVFVYLDTVDPRSVSLWVEWGRGKGPYSYSERFSAEKLRNTIHEDVVITSFIDRVNRAMRQSYERRPEA